MGSFDYKNMSQAINNTLEEIKTIQKEITDKLGIGKDKIEIHTNTEI